MLTLMEDLILIALHDEKGTIATSSSFKLKYGLIGAIIMDLMLRQRIKIDNKKIIVTDQTLTEDELLNEALELFRSVDNIRKIDSWIRKLFHQMRRNSWLFRNPPELHTFFLFRAGFQGI